MPNPSRLSAGAVALAALASCGLPSGEYFGKVSPGDPSHLRYCNSAEPEYLDPAMSSSTADMKPLFALFDGLVSYDEHGTPKPSIAQSWDISADQRTFTFHLRSDAMWSNRQPITAYDFAFSFARVLHPSTTSRNAEVLWRIKNGQLYTRGLVKQLQNHVAGLRAGQIVQIVGLAGNPQTDVSKLDIPDSNLRRSSKVLALRDKGKDETFAYAKLKPQTDVTIVDQSTDGWTYVYCADDDGVYGWVRSTDLDASPHATQGYKVSAVESQNNDFIEVFGRDLLMTPAVLGISTPDAATLILNTAAPVPTMIDIMAQAPFRAVPPTVVARFPKKWTKPENIVTSGPFHLTEWIQRDHITLEKSKTWWNSAVVRLGKITILNMDDQSAIANTYLQGSCDAVTANAIPPSYLPVLTRHGYKDFHIEPYLGIYYFLINNKKFPNVHFRRALSMAIDRSVIPSFTRGSEIPATQFTPGTPISRLSAEEKLQCGVSGNESGVALLMGQGLCYVPPLGPDFDPVEAKKELAIAKKELGAAFPRSVSIKFNTGVETHKLLAEYLQAQWQTVLGISSDLESQEWKTFLKDTVNGEYEIARQGWIGNSLDPEREFLVNFLCDNPSNRSQFCDPIFEQWMTKAEQSTDRKQRLSYVQAAEKVVLDSASVIPLYVYTQKHLVKPYVRGLARNLTDKQPFELVWIDPNWEKDGK